MSPEIVRQGYGHTYPEYPLDNDLMTLFRYHEEQAEEAGRGLWGSTEPIDGKDTEAEKREVRAARDTVSVTATGTKHRAEGWRFPAKSKTPISFEDA